MDRLLTMFAQDYLAGDRPLEHLQQLLMDITWDKNVQVSAEALALAKEIDLHVAEFTGGHITEDVLKGLIREVVGLKPIVLNAGVQPALAQAPTWQSTADTQTRRLAFG